MYQIYIACKTRDVYILGCHRFPEKTSDPEQIDEEENEHNDVRNHFIFVNINFLFSTMPGS